MSPRRPRSSSGPPSHWWGAPLRECLWPADLTRLLTSPVYQGAGVPAGNGSPVLVVPGFATGDLLTAPMRSWLRRIGYEPYASHTVANLDCSDRLLDHLERRLETIARGSGRAVSLVGLSRGGQLSRALAVRRPGRIERVVVMGSGLNDPFAIAMPAAAAVSLTRGYHQRVTDRRHGRGCLTSTCACGYGVCSRSPFPESIELISIIAARDGIVWRDACRIPGATNVEVDAAHVGLAFHPDAYRALGVALARPPRQGARHQPST
jgi:triacylglycerol lipase